MRVLDEPRVGYSPHQRTVKAIVAILFMFLVIYALGVGIDELLYVDLTTAGVIAMGFCITVLILGIALFISGL